jgi:hypothetical protein
MLPKSCIDMPEVTLGWEKVINPMQPITPFAGIAAMGGEDKSFKDLEMRVPAHRLLHGEPGGRTWTEGCSLTTFPLFP